jgi:hypothetical protein
VGALAALPERDRVGARGGGGLRLDRSEIGGLPVWVAPVWIATGLSGGVFASKAYALVPYMGGSSAGSYQRAWALVMPETLAFLAAAGVAIAFGWWLGRRRADTADRPPG